MNVTSRSSADREPISVRTTLGSTGAGEAEGAPAVGAICETLPSIPCILLCTAVTTCCKRALYLGQSSAKSAERARTSPSPRKIACSMVMPAMLLLIPLPRAGTRRGYSNRPHRAGRIQRLALVIRLAKLDITDELKDVRAVEEMIGTILRPQLLRQPAAPARAPGRWLLAGLALILWAGYLLFCHGCHGDEDTELLLSIKDGKPIPSITGAELP